MVMVITAPRAVSIALLAKYFVFFGEGNGNEYVPKDKSQVMHSPHF